MALLVRLRGGFNQPSAHSELHKSVGHLLYRWADHPALEKHLEAGRRAVLIPSACELHALCIARSAENLQDVGEAAAQTVSAGPAHRETLHESPSIVDK